MNVTKSLSSSNVYKSSHTQVKEEPLQRSMTTIPSHPSPSSGQHKTMSTDKGRTNSEAGRGNVLDKIIHPFSSLSVGFGRSSSSSQASKEITGSLSVAKIDQKAIVDCEIFFVDGEAFLQLAKETIELARNSNQDSRLKRFFGASKITRWRAKRKGNKLYSQYEELITRSETCEKLLKAYTEKLLNDSASLMLQALHLKSRLTSCINFNRDDALQLRPVMEDTKEYLRTFNLEKHKVQEMLTFYDEITNIKLSQKDNFVPWALRNANNVQHPLLLSSAMLNRDSIESRLHKLLKTIEIIELMIQLQIPAYHARKSNLEHCTKSLHTMENILVNINSYRTFMKNTDEETLKNTSSRLTTHSDDESHQEAQALQEKMAIEATRRRTLDDEDDDEEEEEDDDEEGFVSNMRVVDNPAFKAINAQKQKDADQNKEKTSSGGNNNANGEGNIKEEKRTNIKRSSTLEELIAQANKSSKRIDDALFVNVHIEPYDHSMCSDCSFVFGMSNDCSMHLAALQHTAQEATLKLQKLLEMRERLKKRAHVLESIDWGGGE